MKREIIRVEPLATFLDKYKAPASMVTKYGDTIYVSGAPPFDPQTGEIFKGAIERQTEIVLEQPSSFCPAAAMLPKSARKRRDPVQRLDPRRDRASGNLDLQREQGRRCIARTRRGGRARAVRLPGQYHQCIDHADTTDAGAHHERSGW